MVTSDKWRHGRVSEAPSWKGDSWGVKPLVCKIALAGVLLFQYFMVGRSACFSTFSYLFPFALLFALVSFCPIPFFPYYPPSPTIVTRSTWPDLGCGQKGCLNWSMKSNKWPSCFVCSTICPHGRNLRNLIIPLYLCICNDSCIDGTERVL